MDELQRAESFVTRLDEALCERVVEWRGGVAYLRPSLPKIWDLNVMRLDDATLSAEEIVTEADSVMGAAGCRHRRVLVRDPRVGAALEPAFTRMGWDVDVHVLMGHVRKPDEIVDTTMVKEVGDATWPSRAEQMRSYPWADEDVIGQLRVLYDLTADAARARDFAIVADGRPVSFAMLYSDGTTGMIEDVATLEPYRSRGLSRAVVTRALEESRALHDFTFLIADDRDWPKHFYSKLGFEPLGRHYYFLKLPKEAGLST